MDQKYVIMLLVLALLVGGIVGYAVGMGQGLDFCADAGIRVLDKLGIQTNISNTELLIKFQQHLNLLN